MKIAIAIALLGVTTVSAAPYYVGENLQPKNNVTLGFSDAPTKKDVAVGRNSTGNIAAFDLKGAYSPMEKVAVRTDLPFYMANKNATAGTSRNSLGNIALGGIWTNALSSSTDSLNYGYSLSTDVYLPTSRKAEAGAAANANPTTDMYKYLSKATSLTPTVGFFLSRDMWSAKTNVGGAWSYFSKSAPARNNKSNHLNVIWQTAATWHARPNIQGNLEYNTLFLDSASGGEAQRIRHAVTPSISGNYEKAALSAYATIPLDKTTRNVTNVAFGLNAGYIF